MPITKQIFKQAWGKWDKILIIWNKSFFAQPHYSTAFFDRCFGATKTTVLRSPGLAFQKYLTESKKGCFEGFQGVYELSGGWVFFSFQTANASQVWVIMSNM